MKKGLIPSLIISVSGYLGYQLKIGEYSGNGEIREELRPAKKWYYYEVDKAYNKSETEVSRFINDMTKLGVQGTFHKIQLDNPDDTKENTRYIIGVEADSSNEKRLSEVREVQELKEANLPQYSAVCSQLEYTGKSQFFLAMQMTFNVLPAIKKYVQENLSNAQFPGLKDHLLIKSITVGSNKALLSTGIAYPFGEDTKGFYDLAKKQKEEAKQQPQQENITPQKEGDKNIKVVSNDKDIKGANSKVESKPQVATSAPATNAASK